MKTNRTLEKGLFFCIFAAYLLILAALLFGKSAALRTVNLIPFRFVEDYVLNRGVLALSNVLGNVALFFPMGVYLAMLAPRRSLLWNLAAVLLISACAEGIQFAFRVGVTDIDDLILNGLGGLLGILCYRGLLRLCREKAQKIVIWGSLVMGIAFVSLFACLHFGVFGFRIRIF